MARVIGRLNALSVARIHVPGRESRTAIWPYTDRARRHTKVPSAEPAVSYEHPFQYHPLSGRPAVIPMAAVSLA